MTEVEWKEERERLLESLRKTMQTAAESQAEAAVYQKFLKECRHAASEALRNKDLNLLYEITGKFSFAWTPSQHEGKQMGEIISPCLYERCKMVGAYKKPARRNRNVCRTAPGR